MLVMYRVIISAFSIILMIQIISMTISKLKIRIEDGVSSWALHNQFENIRQHFVIKL